MFIYAKTWSSEFVKVVIAIYEYENTIQLVIKYL